MGTIDDTRFGAAACDWIGAHAELTRLSRQRAAADAEEGRWLLRAWRAAVHVHLGHGSFTEYVERLFGYKGRTTQEKLRVAEALETLPELARALDAGELSWCAVRELTRVAVTDTEGVWLEAARGKTIRQLEELVANKTPGDTPAAPTMQQPRRRVLRFEVAPETFALFRDAMQQLRRSAGDWLDDDAVLLSMARHVLAGPGDEGRAPYQISLNVCATCGHGEQLGGGDLVPIGTEVVGMAECSAQDTCNNEAQCGTNHLPFPTPCTSVPGGQCQGDGRCAAPPPTDVLRFVAVGGGESHTCGLRSDGTVRCWGGNNVFQTGATSTGNILRPQVVATLAGVSQLSVGARHSCAVVRAQTGNSVTVRCWGENNAGQLGDGTTVNRSTPVTATGAATAQVFAGFGLSCSLGTGGSATCWGAGAQAFGNPGGASPAALTDPDEIFDLGLGSAYCALTADSTIVCTGSNGAGQLGDGTFTSKFDTIVDVVGVTQVRRLFASQILHNCALLADGRLQCWGFNAMGALGDGTTVGRSIAVIVPGIARVTDAALGYSHTCALLEDGTVWCWGDNSRGQLGVGSPAARIPAPTQVTSLSNVRDIGAGWYHTCAVLNDGTMRCWGDNAAGQLGNDSLASSTVPVRVVGP